MLKIIFPIGGLLIAAGLFFALKYGVAPRAIPLIKATEVQTLEQAGVLVYRRLRQEIRSGKLIIAGSLPGEMAYERFWQGFVLGTQSDGAAIGKVISVSGMVPFAEANVMPYEEDSIEKVMDEASVTNENIRRLFYLPTPMMTHLMPESLSKKLDKNKIKNITIALHTFPATKEQARKDCPAKTEEALLKQLDCLALKVLHNNYRIEVDPNKKYITLYRYGLNDYIAFWYQPPSNLN